MKEIDQLIEKFSALCDDVAEIRRLLTWQVENKVTQPLRDAAPEIQKTVGQKPVFLDRKTMLAKLDAAGIPYLPKVRNATLIKIVTKLESEGFEAPKVEAPVVALPKAKASTLTPLSEIPTVNEVLARRGAPKVEVEAPKVEAPKVEVEAPKVEVPGAPTLSELQHYLKEYAIKHGQDKIVPKVRKILIEEGVQKVSKLSEKQRADMLKQLSA